MPQLQLQSESHVLLHVGEAVLIFARSAYAIGGNHGLLAAEPHKI